MLCLTVPRTVIQGFAERVMPDRVPGDNREDYALLHEAKTLIQIREKQMHALAVRYGMQRWKMKQSQKATSEFFKGSLEQALRAMRGVGVGDLYTFQGDM